MPVCKGHRILVTGAAGFIGSNLVYYLLEEAEKDLDIQIDRIVSLDKLTYAGNRENLRELQDDHRHRLVVGDICDEELVSNLLREEEVNLLMHLAAESHVDRSIDASAEFIRTNVVGTHVLLEAFRDWAHEVGSTPLEARINGNLMRFLHVSTDEVYGSLSETDSSFSESTPYAPNSPYSASKAGSDHLARAWYQTYGLPVITTNCSNNYGPYQFPEKLLPLMIGKLRRGEPLPVYGNGSNLRDWLYVKDHCRALALAAVRGNPGEVYNVGGNCEMRNLDVVHALIESFNRLSHRTDPLIPEEVITFVKDRPGHDWRYAVDPSKIHRELGWTPKETFSSGLEKTVSWYLENEAWTRRIEDGSYRGERLGIG